MKKLVEKSITFRGVGHPDTKTIFQLNEINQSEKPTEEEIKQLIENQKILDDICFKSLSTIAGRKLTVWFNYIENEKKIEDKIQLTIPRLDEKSIKNFILESINTKLK